MAMTPPTKNSGEYSLAKGAENSLTQIPNPTSKNHSSQDTLGKGTDYSKPV